MSQRIEHEAPSAPSATPVETEPWTRGEITLYRLEDVGYEIHLDRAAEILSASTPERPRPTRGEAQAIQIPNPPLTVRLGNEGAEVGGRTQRLELSARLFDFGVVSLRAALRVDEPLAWKQLTSLGSDLASRPDAAACFDRWRDQLLERVLPAIQKPGVAAV